MQGAHTGQVGTEIVTSDSRQQQMALCLRYRVCESCERSQTVCRDPQDSSRIGMTIELSRPCKECLWVF